MLGPDLLLPGVSLGQGELPLLLGDEPLPARLVGLGAGGQVISELVTHHNLGWTAANVSEWCVAVVQQSSRELVIVQVARLVHIVPDQLLCDLDPLLCSEVGVGDVGAGQPVPAAPLLEEALGGRGGLVYNMNLSLNYSSSSAAAELHLHL